MVFLIDDKKILKTKLIETKGVEILKNQLVKKILNLLAERPMCALDIAKKLKENPQKIYYYIKKLEKYKIIDFAGYEERTGGLAKNYSFNYSAIAIKLNDNFIEKNEKINFPELKPFIQNGKWNCLIIVGSPDPHGKFSAQGSDGIATMELCAFLGKFLNEIKIPMYKLDTQIEKDELKQNLILIGGPKVNTVLYKINKKAIVYLDEYKDWNIVTPKSIYNDDFIGVIQRFKNPFNKNCEVLILEGKRFKGTRAAIIGFINYYEKIYDKKDFYIIVKGIDRDNDGLIDYAQIVETNLSI